MYVNKRGIKSFSWGINEAEIRNLALQKFRNQHIRSDSKSKCWGYQIKIKLCQFISKWSVGFFQTEKNKI